MKAFPGNDERMSVLHQDSGGIGKSIPSALEISLGHGFCTRRPLGFPSGFARGKSLGSLGAKPMAAGNLSRFPSTLEISLGLRPREISWVSGNLGRRGWIFQSLPPLGGARIQSASIRIKQNQSVLIIINQHHSMTMTLSIKINLTPRNALFVHPSVTFFTPSNANDNSNNNNNI